MSVLQVKASLAFLRKSVPVKIQSGKGIVIGLGANAGKITNLPHTLLVLGAANDDLEDKALLAKSGSHKAIQDKDDSVAAWKQLFRDTGNYVSVAAKGDAGLIMDCGFEVTSSESVHKGDVVSLVHLKGMAQVTPGELVISNDADKNADAYLWIMGNKDISVTKADNLVTIVSGTTTIYLVADTHPEVTVEGLPSNQPLSLFGLGLNLNGMGPVTKNNNNITPQ